MAIGKVHAGWMAPIVGKLRKYWRSKPGLYKSCKYRNKKNGLCTNKESDKYNCKCKRKCKVWEKKMKYK